MLSYIKDTECYLIEYHWLKRSAIDYCILNCLGNYPEGQIMEHGRAEGIDEKTAKDRFTSEEKRALDRLQQDIYQEIRLAAEAHRQVLLFFKC